MLRGKTAVITGANRGIGKAILHLFAENGADIWACSRTQSTTFEDECQYCSESFNVTITPIYFDMTDKEQMKITAKTITSSKKLDILINNAGILADSTSFLMTSTDKMKALFEVNFFAQIEFTQYIARLMIRQKSGSIVNITSIAAIDIDPGQIDYASSKAALIGATRKLAGELGSFGIRVNAIAPGVIDTEMSDKIQQDSKERVLAKTIAKRLGTPREIAGAALFFASDLSSYVTGQILRVDGGM